MFRHQHSLSGFLCAVVARAVDRIYLCLSSFVHDFLGAGGCREPHPPRVFVVECVPGCVDVLGDCAGYAERRFLIRAFYDGNMGDSFALCRRVSFSLSEGAAGVGTAA